MAFDYTTLEAQIQKYIVPRLQDNFFKSTPYFEMLKDKLDESRGGGLALQQKIIYAKNTQGGNFSGSQLVNTELEDKINAVTYTWGHYYVPFGVTFTDELSAGKVVSLIKDETDIAKKTIYANISADAFGTTGTNKIEGLQNQIHTTTDCGGINSTDTSVWAASPDTTTTTLTVPALNGKFGDTRDGNEKCNLIVSNQDCEDKFFNMLEPANQSLVQNGGDLMFRKAKWIVDADCSGSGGGTEDNHIYLLNTNYIILYVHPENNFKVWPFAKPTNQYLRLSSISWSGIIAQSNRRRQGAFKAINPSL